MTPEIPRIPRNSLQRAALRKEFSLIQLTKSSASTPSHSLQTPKFRKIQLSPLPFSQSEIRNPHLPPLPTRVIKGPNVHPLRHPHSQSRVRGDEGLRALPHRRIPRKKARHPLLHGHPPRRAPAPRHEPQERRRQGHQDRWRNRLPPLRQRHAQHPRRTLRITSRRSRSDRSLRLRHDRSLLRKDPGKSHRPRRLPPDSENTRALRHRPRPMAQGIRHTPARCPPERRPDPPAPAHAQRCPGPRPHDLPRYRPPRPPPRRICAVGSLPNLHHLLLRSLEYLAQRTKLATYNGVSFDDSTTAIGGSCEWTSC